MRRALALAERGLGLAAPNPLVGAVVTRGGQVVGEGWHEGPGTPHAEIGALRAAADRARGATLYVTMEPCSHQGRTGPCAPAVAASGVARVVAAVRDPNPAVDGQGLALLQRSGVTVEVGLLQEEGLDLIAGFARHVTTGQPFVTLKMAASLDGKVAARDGTSRWITGEESRRDVHRLRARAGAVMVGAGTTETDRPRLTVRLEGYRGRQPLRVVVDGSGRTAPEGPLFDGSSPTLIATSERARPESVKAWRDAGADVVVVGEGPVSLPDLFDYLGNTLEVQDVLIEGGPTLAWSAVKQDLVDRLVVYLAPELIGGTTAPGLVGGEGIGTITEAVPLAIRTVERIGPDLKVVADVHRDR
jgi:diaminohydroxyphosphoribosylaminopyrimidine deaminase/5-amino-6-(5-phosphoribosylamino)uracil reductase